MLERTPVDPQELAFGIQFTMQLPDNRALAFTTACPQEASPAEMKALLQKMADASDFLDAFYLLRAKKKELEHWEKELMAARQQKQNHADRAAEEWAKRGRLGDFKMSESQAAQYRNFETTEQGWVDRIKALRAQIAELEAATKG